MERIVEICCGSYEDALNAYRGGASRIELNSGLYLGGLTPSLGTLILTKKNTELKVIAMLRPRGAGFHYTDDEFEVMKNDAVLMMEHGADGIAFGCLDENGNIDCVKDPYQAIEKLIDMGVHRILTSGLQPKAVDGKELIKDLQMKYGDQIEILAGSGINADNALEMMNDTGISQVHSSCKDWVNDPTTKCHAVSFGYATHPHEMDYDVVSQEFVEKIVNSL